MSIIRNRIDFTSHFVQIPNRWMRDKRLSRRARGLLAEIMTHSEGWELTVQHLINNGPEGRDAIRGGLKELQEHGYLVLVRDRDEKGRAKGSHYETQIPPEDTSDRETGFQAAGNPVPRQTDTKNTNLRTPTLEDSLHVAPRSSDRPEGFHDHREAATPASPPEQGPREVLDAIQEVANTPRGNYSEAYDRFLHTLRVHYGDGLADYAEHRNWTMGPKERNAYGAQKKLNMLLNTARLECVELQE